MAPGDGSTGAASSTGGERTGDGPRTDGGERTDGADVDPAALQAQLSEIKGAMGLEAQYPGQRRLWLVYGSVVGLASILTEVVFAAVQEGPDVVYQVAWLGFVGVAGLALWRLATGTPTDHAPETAPDWRVVFATLLVGFLALVAMVQPVFYPLEGSLPAREQGLLTGAYFYALVIAVAGMGFLFTGNALRAYRIRARDRRVFYGAGGWMLAFAAVFPHVEFLRVFGYAVFGVLFWVYAVGAYVVLGRSGTD